MIAILVILAVVVTAIVVLSQRKRPTTAAPVVPPVVITDPVTDPVKPPPPPVPPVVVPPVVPPPAPPTVNYSIFMGQTRGSLEYAFKNGFAKKPEGFSWEEFAASGFMELDRVDTPTREDLTVPEFRWNENGAMNRVFEGPAGDYVKYLPVGPDFEGRLEFSLAGERGLSSFGGRIEGLDLVIKDSRGSVLFSELKGVQPKANIDVNKNCGLLTVHIKTHGGGIGYIQVNAFRRSATVAVQRN